MLQAYVGIAGAFCAEITFGGEAGHQSGAGVIDCTDRAECERFVEDLVVPGGFVVGMEEEMAVAFDQAGQQRLVGEGDFASAWR